MSESPNNIESLSALTSRVEELTKSNQNLAVTLRDAREQLVALGEEIEKLSAPPNGFAIYLGVAQNNLHDVSVNGRKMRVTLSPEVDQSDLFLGQEVILNESMNIVLAATMVDHGVLVNIREVLADGTRALVSGRNDEEQVVRLSSQLRTSNLRPGDSVLCDLSAGLAFEKIAKSEVEELVLEEVPDIQYEDIGGLGAQIEMIRDAVELPFLHADLFSEYNLKAPKGILLYGPPGCGKTLIAKAVANSLAKKVAEVNPEGSGKSYFINIKGPELLNKYVGETERQIRLIFQRARDKANSGTPVIVFFDEMDSLFRTRGTGISSDVENTIVPQLLSEIDGVETLENVIVIGASNREDMIDPAILRPGRLDVKIKIERPNAQAAKEIFAKYLNVHVPVHQDEINKAQGNITEAIKMLIASVVARMYDTSVNSAFLEVTYANGDREVLYFKDFSSGAMIENIVARAKKLAIKEQLLNGQPGIRETHLLEACAQEFRENEDLPNTTNPDDWAKISGKKGERIVYMRTLIQTENGVTEGRTIDMASSSVIL